MKLTFEFKNEEMDERTKLRVKQLIQSHKKLLDDFDVQISELKITIRPYRPYYSYGVCYVAQKRISLRPWRGETPERILRTFFHEFGHLVWSNTRSERRAEEVAEYLLQKSGVESDG